MNAKLHNDVSLYRESSGLTQEQLAKKVAVSRQTIIAIERGNYSPSVYLAMRIATVLGVSVTKLFYIDHA